jgi:hypothetical protein
MGDFQFGLLDEHDDPHKNLNQKQHIMFWVLWVLVVMFISLIFLNFIIAEVGSSYNHINENIDAIIYRERAALIWKAEEITSKKTKQNDKVAFAKYIVIRQLEE